MTIVLITFALILGIVLGAYWLFVVRPERAQQRLLRKRLTKKSSGVLASAGIERAPDRLSSLPLLEQVLQRTSGLSGPLERMVTQSGLKLTVGTLLLGSAVFAVVVYLLVATLTRAPLIALLVACAATFVPTLIVKQAAAMRLRKFEEQFPEAIELLARALRAGHAFPTGLQMVADEIPNPVGGEFKVLYDRQTFGMPLPEALKGMADRIPLLDARFFVTSVLTQREAGGNLAEVLQNLASVIRDRFRVKRQVRVVTAHGRITGWILAALPPTLAVVLTIISPQHMQTLLSDPLGTKMIVGAIALQLTGTLMIRKLVNVRY